MKQPAIYIVTNMYQGSLYVGVTSNLVKRIYQHKNSFKPGFTSKYQCDRLVYYEVLDTMINAINREKQIKGGSRSDKIKLIEERNPAWEDLYKNICRP